MGRGGRVRLERANRALPRVEQTALFRACFNLRALCALCYLDFYWGLPPTDKITNSYSPPYSAIIWQRRSWKLRPAVALGMPWLMMAKARRWPFEAVR